MSKHPKVETRGKGDKELAALAAIMQALEPLSEEQLYRVLEFIRLTIIRYHIGRE